MCRNFGELCCRGALAEFELILEIFGEGLIAAIGRRQSQISRHVDLAYEWLREAARPPRGVRLVADDGSSYSGIAVFERNEVALMVAFRHVVCAGRGSGITPPSSAAPAASTYPGRYVATQEFGVSKYEVDPDDPMWDRDGDPYRR